MGVKNGGRRVKKGKATAQRNCIKLWIAEIAALRQLDGSLSELECLILLTLLQKTRLTQ